MTEPKTWAQRKQEERDAIAEAQRKYRAKMDKLSKQQEHAIAAVILDGCPLDKFDMDMFEELVADGVADKLRKKISDCYGDGIDRSGDGESETSSYEAQGYFVQ